jgi:hypothetical protein
MKVHSARAGVFHDGPTAGRLDNGVALHIYASVPDEKPGYEAERGSLQTKTIRRIHENDIEAGARAAGEF